MKVCSKCHRSFPLSSEHFYKQSHARDGFMPYCKSCAKAYQKERHNQLDSRRNPHESELKLVDHLKANGVYAHVGYAPYHSFVDIVAWGCIRIDVKSSQLGKNGQYRFNLKSCYPSTSTPNPDFICLHVIGYAVEYALLPYRHEVFWRRDGRMKTGIAFTPEAQWRNGASLTPEIVAKYSNIIGRIEAKRLEKIATRFD